MNRRIAALTVAFTALLAQCTSFGQNVLIDIPSGGSSGFEPVDGYFSSYALSHDYHSQLRNILLKGVTDKPDAMLVTLASFQAESAIVVNEHEVHILTCSEPIWNSKDPEKITIQKRTLRVSKELAGALHSLWFDSLGATSYPESHRHGRDGTSYFFTSYKAGQGLRAGKAWSPIAKSLPAKLVEVALELEKLNDGAEDDQSELLTRVMEINVIVLE